MAGPVVAVTFIGKTYLISKEDFDRRPYSQFTSTDVRLPHDAKLVPFGGGDPITVGEVTKHSEGACFTYQKFFIPDNMQSYFEGVYWGAIANSQDPSYQAKRVQNVERINLQILNNLNGHNEQLNNLDQGKGQWDRTYAQVRSELVTNNLCMTRILDNSWKSLNSCTLCCNGQRLSSQDYDNVIRHMQEIVANQKQYNLSGRRALNAEFYRYFQKLKQDIRTVREDALRYLAQRLAKRGLHLRDYEVDLLNGKGQNVTLEYLSKIGLLSAGFDPYRTMRMLAMKDVACNMKRCMDLCDQARNKKIPRILNLADFYNSDEGAVPPANFVPAPMGQFQNWGVAPAANFPFKFQGVSPSNFAPASAFNPFLVLFVSQFQRALMQMRACFNC